MKARKYAAALMIKKKPNPKIGYFLSLLLFLKRSLVADIKGMLQIKLKLHMTDVGLE